MAAEAPDGAIFFACSSSDCTNSGSSQAHSVVRVVERTGTPAVAENVSGLVQAIAASSTDLFVATNTSITEYSRANGQVVCHWSDPTNVTPSGNFYPTVDLAYGDGLLWADYGIATDQSGYEPSILERIVPGSSGQPPVVSSDVGQTGVVVGPSGAFFGDYTDNTIHAVAADGSPAGSSGTLPVYPNSLALQAEVQGGLIASQPRRHRHAVLDRHLLGDQPGPGGHDRAAQPLDQPGALDRVDPGRDTARHRGLQQHDARIRRCRRSGVEPVFGPAPRAGGVENGTTSEDGGAGGPGVARPLPGGGGDERCHHGARPPGLTAQLGAATGDAAEMFRRRRNSSRALG